MPQDADEYKVKINYNGTLYEVTYMIGKTIGEAKAFFVSELKMSPDVTAIVAAMSIREDMAPYVKNSSNGLVTETVKKGARIIQCKLLEVSDEYILDRNDLMVEFRPKDEQSA